MYHKAVDGLAVDSGLIIHTSHGGYDRSPASAQLAEIPGTTVLSWASFRYTLAGAGRTR